MNKRRLAKALRRLYYLPASRYFFAYTSNKFKHFYYKLTKSTKVAYPSTIMLELTNHCNLACTICPREYEYGKQMDKGMMEVKHAKKIIDEVIPYLDSIGLTGMGETFMYKQIKEVVDYIKSKNKGVIISVSTNAVLPDFIGRVKDVIGKIDTIQVSIDGLNEVYNSIRINSDFSILDKNIRELAKLSEGTTTDIMLNMVVTKENYTHMPALVQYAADAGVKFLDFTLFNLASVTGYDLDYYDFYESDEFLDTVAQLEKAISEYPEVLVTGKNFKTDKGFKNCPFPWSHFYVSQDGYVPPCCAKPFPKEKHFGSTHSHSLIEVLNSDDFRQWREMWYENETPDFCKKCHFINIDAVES